MYSATRSYIQQLMEEKVIPGASYGFIQKDKEQTYRVGLAAVIPEEEPIQENQMYDVASLTKVIMTTTLILQLWEAGKLAFDDQVKQYLPSFHSEKVTIRHLLTHTSELNGYIPNRDSLSAEQLKEALFSLPVGSEIGKKVNYTDTNFILLGYIIEELEGDTLTTIFHKRVIQPLLLKQTTFHPANPELCAPTENHPSRGLIRGVVHDPKARTLGDHCGSAGLFSSLADIMQFSKMLLRGGTLNGVEILQKSTVEMLLRDWTPTGNLGRSLGWDLKQSNNKHYLFHTGFTGTFVLLDVEQQEAFVFLSNRVHPENNNAEYLNKRGELLQVYFAEKDESIFCH